MLVIVILASVMGILSADYFRLRQELLKRKREEERTRERARERAGRMVNEAKDKAVEIVREAEVLSAKQADDLERRLRRATRENVEEYTKVLRQMAQKIGQEAWGGVADFKKSMETGTVEMERAVAERIGAEYDKARMELERYKLEKKVKLDAQAVETVKELGRRVLGKVIPAEEHKKLILEALKEVEAENGL